MIPIILKDFKWYENKDWLFVIVEVKGLKSASTDVVTSPTYLKVHCSPFIFELFLAHPVDDAEGDCIVDERSEKVSFRFRKNVGDHLWETVEMKGLSREDKAEIRKKAIELTQERHKQSQTDKEKRRFDRKQTIVRDQIDLDAKAKERVTNIKEGEGHKALVELEQWKDSQVENAGAEAGSPPKDKSIFTLADTISAEDHSPKKDTQTTNLAVSQVAGAGGGDGDVGGAVGIRPSVCIPVKFTPRIFPTPARESSHAEEQEWLKKQAEARKLSGFIDEDLRPEERNPEWLLDKGLSLMRTSSYLGAISAFSLGIRLCPKMAELFVARAGAHLALQNYHRTVEDCSRALELLTPKVPGNSEDRLLSYMRRGSAFLQLEMWEEALADYKACIQLNTKPEYNEELSSGQAVCERKIFQRTKAIQMEKEKPKNKVSNDVGGGGGGSSEEEQD